MLVTNALSGDACQKLVSLPPLLLCSIFALASSSKASARSRVSSGITCSSSRIMNSIGRTFIGTPHLPESCFFARLVRIMTTHLIHGHVGYFSHDGYVSSDNICLPWLHALEVS